MRCTSVQGRARGGRSAQRMRGATTNAEISRLRRPLTQRKRRKDLKELQTSATVLLETRAERHATNASMSVIAVLHMALPLLLNKNKKSFAVSISRWSVPSATPRCDRRNRRYSSKSGDIRTRAHGGCHSGTAAPNAVMATVQA